MGQVKNLQFLQLKNLTQNASRLYYIVNRKKTERRLYKLNLKNRLRGRSTRLRLRLVYEFIR